MSSSRLSNGSVSSPTRLDLQTGQTCWTDDLPVCHYSGVGFSTNQIYREDGNRREEHEFEDKNFHFSQDNICLYGVFDGHDSARASNFAAQRMPAELLLGQLVDKTRDEQIKEVLYQVLNRTYYIENYEGPMLECPLDLLQRELQRSHAQKKAFIAVEKSYFESIDEKLAERTTLQLQLPEGINYHEACIQYPDIVSKLHALNVEISGGTTATIVLIYNNKIYVANVGDTRVLLVRTDMDNIMSVNQLTMDHTIISEQEQNRLRTLGLDVEKLFQMKRIGTSDCTRCIGDFHVKGGYRDIDILSSAISEPVIADPYVTGGFPIDKCTSFLIIMSDGLYQALQDATDTASVNSEVASMVAKEFAVQSTLNGVAQACVDRVVRIHHDSFMMGAADVKARCQKRGDITLLVRNFNYKLPNAIGTPTGINRHLPVSVPYVSARPLVPTSILITDPAPVSFEASVSVDESATPVAGNGGSLGGHPGNLLDTNCESTRGSRASSGTYSTTNSTQSSEETRFQSRFYQREKLVLDENGRIEAYVDFSDFYRAIEAMTDSQRETLNAETKPKSSIEPIAEEPSSLTRSISSTGVHTPNMSITDP